MSETENAKQAGQINLFQEETWVSGSISCSDWHGMCLFQNENLM